MRGLEAFARDVSLKVGIVTTVVNSVVFYVAVKLDKKFEVVEFIGQLALLMSETEFFCAKPANFFIATEQEPRLDFGKLVNFYESENATAIIAANALRGHKDISVSGEANIANGLFMDGIEMSDEHDGSLSLNENEISFAG